MRKKTENPNHEKMGLYGTAPVLLAAETATVISPATAAVEKQNDPDAAVITKATAMVAASVMSVAAEAEQ